MSIQLIFWPSLSSDIFPAVVAYSGFRSSMSVKESCVTWYGFLLRAVLSTTAHPSETHMRALANSGFKEYAVLAIRVRRHFQQKSHTNLPEPFVPPNSTRVTSNPFRSAVMFSAQGIGNIIYKVDYTRYLSDDSIETEDDGERLSFTIEFLNSINPSGMPQHRLRLKVGAVVMLLRNLETKKGLCNGNKLVINIMRSNVIEAKVISVKRTAIYAEPDAFYAG
nr:unnamed protein product [Callosobruchus analis]